VLHVEKKDRKLGFAREIDRYQLIGKGITVKAQPAHSPKVTVMDVWCKPIANADVWLREFFGLSWLDIHAGKTDESGECTVPAVYVGGKYEFRAVLPGLYGYGSGGPTVGSENWIDNVEIVLDVADRERKGKVVDEKSRPIAGVRVVTDFGPETLTDAKGEFVLTDMPDHLVIIQARKGDLYGANYVKARVQDPEKIPIVIRKLPPGMDPMGG
jgi:hypothetical protein